jgi:multidrug resistance efflux pump
MAKTPKGDTFQKLLDEAQAKLTTARAAVEQAEADFAAAGNDADKQNAQTALNAAARDVARYEAMVAKMAGGGEADEEDETLRSFICREAIKHNGEDYGEGDDIELTKREYLALPRGAVVG